jgi:hypothetical protein
MESKKDIKNEKKIKDALGRPLEVDHDSIYYISIIGHINNVSDFYKSVEKVLKNTGTILCHKKSNKNYNHTLVKVSFKDYAKFLNPSNPKHYAIMNRILRDIDHNSLNSNEWVNVKYAGYAGIINQKDSSIKLCDVHAIEYNGLEYNI